MIPKIIHCVWLSGDEKPLLYKKCLDSWKKVMPEFEIKEWSLTNLPAEILNHKFVAKAIENRKWAYATDVIRLWALYNYGGVYLDLDVEVYKNFEPFLKHRAFSCTELEPNAFYNEVKNLNKKNFTIKGLNIEAAVLGAEKNHIWIKEIFEYYKEIEFKDNQEYLMEIIMPRIVSKISERFGFKYIPLYQVLDEDIHIYPPDTFSWIYDMNNLKNETSNVANNPIRYSRHMIGHGWWEKQHKQTILDKIKSAIVRVVGLKNIKSLKKTLSLEDIKV